MTDVDQENTCIQPDLSARRITLKDGRYLIFFEFDTEAGEQPAPEAEVSSKDV
jgi:hypothetical protein